LCGWGDAAQIVWEDVVNKFASQSFPRRTIKAGTPPFDAFFYFDRGHANYVMKNIQKLKLGDFVIMATIS